MQDVFDKLYADSKQGKAFSNLYEIIISEQNILLAYRSIKSNKGSATAGVNHKTIKDWHSADTNNYVRYVQKKPQNFFPHNCGVTGEKLRIGHMEIHHKLPKELGGTDQYKNLIWVTSDVHKLIHAVDNAIKLKYLERVKPSKNALDKINKLRKSAGKCVIE